MLAFDDGPLWSTEEILDTLKDFRVTATFFVVGKNIDGNEDMLGRMIAEGHRIGNHSWSHQPLVEKPRAEIALEIVRTDAAIYGITGIKPALFRPPFVRWNDGLVVPTAQAFGHRVYVEPSFGDYNLDADAIVLAAAGRNHLWLHEGIQATIDALPEILEARR